MKQVPGDSKHNADAPEGSSEELNNPELPTLKRVEAYRCIVRDKKLSWRARWLYVFLRSYGRGYHHFSKKLEEELGWDRKTIAVALGELEHAKIVDRYVRHNSDGYAVYEWFCYPVRKGLYARLLAEISRIEDPEIGPPQTASPREKTDKVKPEP